MITSIFNHDHGTVVEIADTLACGFTLFDDFQPQQFAWNEPWFQGVGHVIQIDDLYALYAGDFVEIKSFVSTAPPDSLAMAITR